MIWGVLAVIGPILAAMAIGALAERFWPWRERSRGGDRWLHAFILSMLSALVLGVLFPASHAVLAEMMRTRGVGLMNALGVPLLLAIPIGFVIIDLAEWFAHWVMHRVPAFWRLHAVHHSDAVMDTSTAFRFHPIEVWLRYGIVAAVIVALGIPAIAVLIYGVALLVFNLWEHANLSMPPRLGPMQHVFITPDLHRLHHAEAPALHDRNFGVILSVWDRWFGTLAAAEKLDDRVGFGLGEKATERFSRLGALLVPLQKP